MNTKLRVVGLSLVAAVSTTAVHQSGAALLYKNNGGYDGYIGQPFALATGQAYDPPVAITKWWGGNQVTAEGSQPDNAANPGKYLVDLREFKCDYWSTAPVTARLLFFANDGSQYGAGGPVSPGTVLYDSGFFTLPVSPVGGSYQSLEASAANGDWLAGQLLLPRTFTWAVQFTNIDLFSDNAAGLIIVTNDLPQWHSLGTNVNEYSYWQYEKTNNSPALWGWTARTNTAYPNNFFGFAAQFQGELVPEPSPVFYAVMVFGGVGFWFFRRRMQRAVPAK